MATDPWAKFRVGAAPAPVQGPSGNDPVIAPADPYKRAAEGRAQTDQALQIERANRDREEADRKRREWEATHNPDGTPKIPGGSLDPKTIDGQRNIAAGILKNTGVNLQTGDDPVADLILKSTSGGVQKFGAQLYGDVTGTPTSGMKAIAALKPMLADMTLQMAGGSLGAQISDGDRKFIMERMGNIADPSVTAEERLASWDEVKRRLAQMSGIEMPALPQDSGSTDEGLTGTVTDDRPAGMVVRGTDGGTNGPNGGGTGPTPPDQSGITGINTLLRQGVTLGLNDEATGIGGAIGAFLTGGDPNKAYYTERDWQRAKVEAARRAWPNAGNAFEFLGGLGAAGASAIGAAAPTARQIIGGGAALGGIAGFGEGQGAGDSIARGAVGAGANALLGYGLVRATPLVERTVSAVRRPAPQIDTAVVEAGSRQNIPVRQPDANPALRGRYAQAESSQTGGPMIRSARAADAAAMEQRVSEIGGQGNAADPYALGQTVQNAGERYIARTRQQAGRLYDRARQLSGNATVTARNADAVIDANIQELRAAGENSNAAAISYLEGLRNDIDRGLTIESVQNLRTNMRGQIGQQGLTGTDTERRVSMVIDAMNQDLAEQLPKGAVQALKAADAFYKERQTFINDTLKQFMGSRGNPLPAETAASRLVAMTKGKGNFDRFANMWGQLEPAEQADVAATIAASLGRGRNDEFSPAALVQSLDPQKGINPRTARLVFGDDGAKALNDLRILASAKRDAMDRLSPSGQAISGQVGGLKTLLVGLLGLSQGGPAGAIAGGAAQNILTKWGEQRAARMLLNPDFTRWLRAAPQTTNPKVIDRYFARLGTIASVSANDNAAFAGAVRSAVAGSPGAAAAQDQQNPG